MMYKAGYNPRAMAQFFAKLEKEVGKGGPQFLSDHPNPGNRVEAVDKEIASWPPKQYVAANPVFQQVRQQAKGMKAYNAEQISAGAKTGQWAQQSGAVPRDVAAAGASGADAGTLANVSYQQVAPSGEFKNFQRNNFSISYPANWEAGAGQNSATIAPAAGIGQNAIAYGAIIASAENVDAISINDATDRLIQNLQQTNPGLRVYESPRKIQAAGTEAMSTMLAGNSPVRQGDQIAAERDWLVTLAMPSGGMLHIVFIAPESQFAQLQSTYQKMLDSLQVR